MENQMKKSERSKSSTQYTCSHCGAPSQFDGSPTLGEAFCKWLRSEGFHVVELGKLDVEGRGVIAIAVSLSDLEGSAVVKQTGAKKPRE